MKARPTASGCACLWPVLCLLLLHAVSNLVQAEEFGISTYTVTPQNTVTITKASNPTGAIVLPSSINGMPVTAIGIGAFPGSFNLTNLTLPDSITSIGYVAFSGCGSLTSVTLLGSLTSIGHSTFEGCNRLNLPASLTSIGISTFENCTSLNSLTLPDSLTSIGNFTFSGCNALTSPNLPASLTVIGNYTFAYCTGLTSLILPSSLTSIGSGTFFKCSGLTGLTLPASLTSIGNDVFHSCSSLARITFLGTAPSGNYLIYPDYPLPPGYTTYWLSSKTGFTSPTWQSYPSVMIDEAVYPAASWLLKINLPYDTSLQQDPDGDGVSFLMAYALSLDPRLNLSS